MTDASIETNPDGAPSSPPSELPPPAPISTPSSGPIPAPPARPAPPLAPGQLTVAWQIMLAASWCAAFLAMSMVWKTSEEIGIGTWWLGPRARPQPIVVRILPFALTMLLGLLAVYNVRRAAAMSLLGSVALAGVAVFDISRSGGLAAIEFAIAGSMLLVSIGALAASARRIRT